MTITPQEELAQQVRELDSVCDVVETHIGNAFSILEQTIQGDNDLAEDIDRALKSYALDATINKILHSPSS